MARAASTELQRVAASSVDIMLHYRHHAQAALETFEVELNHPREETPDQYTMAFGQVTEALEKMPTSLEEKLWAEARFAAVEYIFACFISCDPNFCLEPMEEGI
ncbi:hypothetical protein E2562_026908 [Oryza meyeriana var. granulata]|uniref:Uncharacterized protein n=1 Tax=Oryza meyeriana var. granulata TaxID=110450 RepID=A0A6G1CTF4_9ORYZ|nr:hypothetical protein E2562_026908 [Oryza meyeriana var. granulata]